MLFLFQRTLWSVLQTVAALVLVQALVYGERAFALSKEQKSAQFNRRSEITSFENRDSPDIANAPNKGLNELNKKIWRFHEFRSRYEERDELDMLFIQNHLKYRDKRSAVVLLSNKMAVLVWLDERTKKAKHVSPFFGRNIYRIKQIAHDTGLLVRNVGPQFADPRSRTPASNTGVVSLETNAKSYAETLVRENPLPTRSKTTRDRPTRFRQVLR